jgi:ABC-type dipeptide/oligopeptide/nickel transport system permease component
MLRYILRLILFMIPVAILVSFLTFIFLHHQTSV